MKTCPKCGADVTDTYEEYDPSVGIENDSWYCDSCELVIEREHTSDE